MRSPSLSRRSNRLPDGRLVSAYEFEGESIWVCDSAYDALCIIDLLDREDLDAADKSIQVFERVFPCIQCVGRPQDYLYRLLSHILWEAFGLDITEDHAHEAEYEPPIFDFAEDAARIRAALLSYYGLDWDSQGQAISYTDLLSLLSQVIEADHEKVSGNLPNFRTSFAQAVFYRTAKPPKADKLNKGIRKAFMEMTKGYALGRSRASRDRAEAANDAMAALMASARRGA